MRMERESAEEESEPALDIQQSTITKQAAREGIRLTKLPSNLERRSDAQGETSRREGGEASKAMRREVWAESYRGGNKRLTRKAEPLRWVNARRLRLMKP